MSTKTPTIANTTTHSPRKQRSKADVIVIGAGASGIAAALTASLGGASVIVVEKAEKFGGCANYAEGIFGVETQMQREHWMNVTRDETFIREMNDSRWEANIPLVRRFQNQSSETIDWLISQGVEFDGPTKIEWTNQPTWHVVKGHGKALARTLFDKLKGRPNVEIMLRTKAKELLKKDGAVNGLQVENVEGELIDLHATGGVIVATGGFANSPEMLKQFANLEDPVQIANIDRTGDGINMAHAAGAQFDNMSPLMLMSTLDVHSAHQPSFENLLLGIVGSGPRNIWVDRFGKRFISEEVGFDSIFAGNALRRVKFAWGIFDDSLKNYYMTKGIDGSLGVVIPPMTKVENFDQRWDQAIKSGEGAIVKADSLEALAKAISVPFTDLKATFDTYNSGAAANLDSEFAKSRRWLQVIDTKGPLYAAKLTYGVITTLGGIKVDNQLRALNSDEVPISGLYCTGNDAGGLTASDTYTFTVSAGTSFGFAVGSGRLAAQEILAVLAGRTRNEVQPAA
jgi:fumarate reductase flavoprotein subunit